LVVEARHASGALITADLAKQMGKRIFAMPGNITDPKTRGSNELIRDGATPVIEVSDILCELEFSYPKTVSVRRSVRERLEERGGYISRRRRRKEALLSKMKESKEAFREEIPKKETFPDTDEKKEPKDLSVLSPVEKEIYEFISKGTTTADIIGRELSKEQSEVLFALTMLEIYELITSLPGGAYEVI
jgi:predicted Rossmann fold nucleotide-binding protein DprA/Smf involved in DNA uptake